MDEGGHHGGVAAHVAVEGELVAGAVQVVGRILDFVVGVAVDVVGEETHTLHEGEQCHGIGQHFNFNGGEEIARRFQITSRERLEDGFVETDL